MSIPTWAAAVQASLSTLSVLGGLAIAVLWTRSPQRGHLRQLLVLGLGLTDQTCVIASACWSLAIAITTYTTLVHPFSRLTAAFETRGAFPTIAAIVLFVSIVPSIPITAVYKMINAGGLCWLEPGTRRAQLTLFVPRATALLLVICLYTRLFIFFRRRDTGLLDSSLDENSDPEVHAGKRLSVANVSARLASWHSRRSSDTLHHPPPQHTRSAPLAAVPGSPVRFNESFPSRSRAGGDADLEAGVGKPSASTSKPRHPLSPTLSDARNERQHSVTVSFSGLDATDPASSGGSTPDLSGGGGGSSSGPSPGAEGSGASTRTKRPSSAGFPARLSVSSSARGGGGPSSQPGRGGRPLSPRQLSKRLSLLMAVFPLAYAALVAVSIARLIQEMSTNARAPTGLLFTARFLIMSQGAIDGLLFVFVQVAFRWWCRRDTEPA
ncbi:hypothetical protein JCM10450v2_000415 [Rhodotorula kratochvilovae]